MGTIETPDDWGKWILENITDKRKHQMLESALVKHIPGPYQNALKETFLKYAESRADVSSMQIADKTERLEVHLSITSNLEKQLHTWLERQQPELTKNMYYAGSRSLRSLTAAMEQLCWIAERLRGNYNQEGLEYQEMTRLCTTDAVCALDLCSYWIDILLGYVQDLNAEIVDVVTLETKDLASRIDSESRDADYQLASQQQICQSKIHELTTLNESNEGLQRSLKALEGKTGGCLGTNKSILRDIENTKTKIMDQRRKIWQVYAAINECQQKISRCTASVRLVSSLRGDMKGLDAMDGHLRETMAIFKTKLGIYRYHIAQVHNAAETMGSTTDWKDGSAVALLETARHSLFCYPMVPYAQKIVEIILEGYGEASQVPPAVTHAVDLVTAAITNLHAPFPLPLPADVSYTPRDVAAAFKDPSQVIVSHYRYRHGLS